jgi:predicted SPOUT superfamily RNA methylase MTH1
MLGLLMPHQKIWVALPDTLLLDSQHLREKTAKLGIVARGCGTFGVHKIFLYRDSTEEMGEADLIRTIMEYLDTPQYLRRLLYEKRRELEYAGLLPPLKTPNHKLAEKPQEIRRDDYRDGVVVERGGNLFANVGLKGLVPIQGRATVGVRVTVRFTSEHPNLRCIVVRREEVKKYWGYEVKESNSLKGLIRSLNANVVVLTSRWGRPLTEKWSELVQAIWRAESILLVFGTPRHGISEILEKEKARPADISGYVLNMFPGQWTTTIRSEEALFGTLSILNLAKNLREKPLQKSSTNT